jgi:hypothetical protein
MVSIGQHGEGLDVADYAVQRDEQIAAAPKIERAISL